MIRFPEPLPPSWSPHLMRSERSHESQSDHGSQSVPPSGLAATSFLVGTGREGDPVRDGRDEPHGSIPSYDEIPDTICVRCGIRDAYGAGLCDVCWEPFKPDHAERGWG